ncbi:hypothetical protein Efla_004063 [Eimeria flavescens]
MTHLDSRADTLPESVDYVGDATACKNGSCAASRRSRLLALLYTEHPCIWWALGTLRLPTRGLLAVLPYPLGGTLHTFLFRRRQRREYLSEAEACLLFCQAATAVHFLHSNNVSHGNISSDELVFLSDGVNGRLHLSLLHADTFLGYSKTLGYACSGSSVDTASLEQNANANASADIRALGTLLYELCCLELPPSQCKSLFRSPQAEVHGGSIEAAAEKRERRTIMSKQVAPTSLRLTSTKAAPLQKRILPPISQRYSSEVADLAELLLLGESSSLPSAAAILQRSFLRKWTASLKIQWKLQNKETGVRKIQNLATVEEQLLLGPSHQMVLQGASNATEPGLATSASQEQANSNLQPTVMRGPESSHINVLPTHKTEDFHLAQQENASCKFLSPTQARTSPVSKLLFWSSVQPPLLKGRVTAQATTGQSPGPRELNPACVVTSPSTRAACQLPALLIDGIVFEKLNAIPAAQQQGQQHLSGEAAVRAVLAARKRCRQQENERAERLLSAIRTEYAKDCKALENALKERLLLEGKSTPPGHPLPAYSDFQKQQRQLEPLNLAVRQHAYPPPPELPMRPRSTRNASHSRPPGSRHSSGCRGFASPFSLRTVTGFPFPLQAQYMRATAWRSGFESLAVRSMRLDTIRKTMRSAWALSAMFLVVISHVTLYCKLRKAYLPGVPVFQENCATQPNASHSASGRTTSPVSGPDVDNYVFEKAPLKPLLECRGNNREDTSDTRVRRWQPPVVKIGIKELPFCTGRRNGLKQIQQQKPSVQVVARLRIGGSFNSSVISECSQSLLLAQLNASPIHMPNMNGRLICCPTPTPTPDPTPMAPFPCHGPQNPPSRVFLHSGTEELQEDLIRSHKMNAETESACGDMTVEQSTAHDEASAAPL